MLYRTEASKLAVLDLLNEGDAAMFDNIEAVMTLKHIQTFDVEASKVKQLTEGPLAVAWFITKPFHTMGLFGLYYRHEIFAYSDILCEYLGFSKNKTTSIKDIVDRIRGKNN